MAMAAASAFSSTQAATPLPCHIIEYSPAPGQFVNTDLSDPAANPLLTEGEVLTLGAFGGYVVIALDEPVTNNPFGEDFAVIGNAMTDSATGETSASEPAAVQVMADLNGNGIPDDGEWLELAGSDYWLDSTGRNVSVTYRNPCYSVAHDIPWTAFYGESGAIHAVAAHTQPYYPDSYIFPAIGEELTLNGNLIRGAFDNYNPLNIHYSHLPAFGYADTHQTDGFDIDWAVDRDGNSVELDQIDFIRIYTAGLRNLGRLGEWSSEIDCIVAAESTGDDAREDIYLNYLYSPSPIVLLGERVKLQGLSFVNGHPMAETTAEYASSNPEVATVAADGTIYGLTTGKAEITFSSTDCAMPDRQEIAVANPTGVAVTIGERTAQTASTECIVGEQIFIPAVTLVECPVLEPAEGQYFGDDYTWTCSAPEVGSIDASGCFHAYDVGTAVVSVWRTANPNHYAEVQVRVKNAPPVVLLRKELTIPADQPQGAYRASALLRTTNKSEPRLVSVESRLGLLECHIEGNRLAYDCNAGENATESGTLTDTLILSVEHYGTPYSFELPVTFTRTLSGTEQPTSGNGRDLLEIFTTTGLRIDAATTKDATAEECLQSLPSGIYLIRHNGAVKKILKK